MNSRSTPPPSALISHVLVVVPARDEEERLGTCLHHVQLAMDQLAFHHNVTVRLSVVVDSSTDGSLCIAQEFSKRDPRIGSLNVVVGSPGRARDAGIRAGLDDVPASELGGVLVACTDGDTFVPADWLVSLVNIANEGADAILGTVEPDPRDTDPELAKLWHERHDPLDGTEHIYGANMAFRADAYLQAGGFPAYDIGEDAAFIRALRDAGKLVVGSTAVHAVTSGRLQGRTAGGFAGYLRDLQPGVRRGERRLPAHVTAYPGSYPSALPRRQ